MAKAVQISPGAGPAPLDWQEAISVLDLAFKSKRKDLLGVSGFLVEYGVEHLVDRLDKGSVYEFSRRAGRNFSREARVFIDELVGILAKAAVERVHKPTSKREILRGLKHVQTSPRDIQVATPDVQILIAGCYRRDDGPSGTDGFDLIEYEPGRRSRRPLKTSKATNSSSGEFMQFGSIKYQRRGEPLVLQDPVAEKTIAAAQRAEMLVRESTKAIRKLSPMKDTTASLARELRQWLTRFGKELTWKYQSIAHSVLDIVLEPLNEVVEAHGGKPFPRKYLVELMCNAQT